MNIFRNRTFISFSFALIVVLAAYFIWYKTEFERDFKLIAVSIACSAIVFIGLFEILLIPHNRYKLILSFIQDFDDIRRVKSDECKYKRLALIKKLQLYRKYSVNYQECDLSDLHIERLKFKNCNMRHINFSKSGLFYCHFENVDLVGCDFSNSRLHNCTFKNCKMDSGVNYWGCGLFQCEFKGSDLHSFDMTNQLNNAHYIYDCRNISPELLIKIQSDKPELLEKPDAAKMSTPKHLYDTMDKNTIKKY